MKIFLTVTLFLISVVSFSQSFFEADPHRGLYVDKFVKPVLGNSSVFDVNFSILGVDENRDGIFEKEDALLKYAAENHITYLAMYDLNRFFGRNFMVWDENLLRSVNLEVHLNRFMKKAKSQYGITQLGAIGGSVSFFDSLNSFLTRYPDSDFDVVNIEYEFWHDCANDFSNYIPILDAMYSFKENYNLNHPTNPIISESYLAALLVCNGSVGTSSVVQTIDGCTSCSPCSSCSNPHSRQSDRILYAWFVADPGTMYLGEQNTFENILSEDSTDFHPILYSESVNTGGTVDFTGAWFPLSRKNNIFTAEESYYTHWKNDNTVAFGTPRQNNVQPGGVQWFTASNMVNHLSQPQILQNSGPYCTSDSLQLISFNYYGPIESGIAFQFWITNQSDGSTVYPVAGGKIHGLSTDYQAQTATSTLKPGIDFSDSLLFPPCYLPHGNYSAHLLLNYENGNGKSYECNNNVSVDLKPRISINGRAEICEGDYTYLQVNGQPGSQTWYRNGKQIPGSGQDLKVEIDGDYYCYVSGGTCPGMTDTIHVHVKPNPAIALNAVCNANGTATIKTNLLSPDISSTVNSGLGAVQYKWNNGATTDQITVTPGTSNTVYRVNVTDLYSQCIRSARITLKSPLTAPFASSITINSQPSSSCSSDGIITANLFSGGGPNNYLWSNGETTRTISGLSPGTYSVAMNVWAAGCTSYNSITLGSTPSNIPSIQSVIQHASCNNSHDGSIQLNLTGGNPPFSYFWDDFPDDSIHNPFNKDQINLFPGMYVVRVEDVTGCVFYDTVEVSFNNSSPVINLISTTPVTGCSSASNGTATVSSVFGGSLPYSYNWNDALHQTTSTAHSLAAGSVEVIVSDANGCTNSAFATVASVELPLQAVILDSSRLVTSCIGIPDGSVYINIIGGETPYIVSSPWLINNNIITLENISPGNYPFLITDNSGCILSDSISVREPEELKIYSEAHNTNCIGCADGFINLSFSGGTPPYQINYLPASGQLSGNTILNLASGIVDVCVTDKFGCTVCKIDTILEDPQGLYSFIKNNSFFVYPNPVSETINVKIQRNNFTGSISLMNTTGKVILSEIIKSSDHSFQSQTISPGIYFIKVFSDTGISLGVRKLIVLAK